MYNFFWFLSCSSPISQAILNKLDRDDDGFTGKEDCDDEDPLIHPDASEICNELDDDCDGLVDDLDLDIDVTTGSTFFVDHDLDGHGNESISILSCSLPIGYSSSNDDCDDDKSQVCPSCMEICDELDNNCDTVIDDDAIDLLVGFLDSDGDGYGSGVEIFICEYQLQNGESISSFATDCDENNPMIAPNQDEICNELDDDCDGLIDDQDDSRVGGDWFYKDDDGDSYGDFQHMIQQCMIPEGYVINADDCDDTDSSIHPNQIEVCNGIDDDCSVLLTGIDNQEENMAYWVNSDGIGVDLSSIYQAYEELMISDGTLYLCNGQSSFRIEGENINIFGLGDMVVWNAIGQTSNVSGNVILQDVQLEQTSLQFDSADVVLENIQITNTTAPIVSWQSSIQATNIILENNTATNGGAIQITDGTLMLNNSAILDNQAELGGGLYTDRSTIHISETRIDFNQATDGGALYILDSEIVVTGQQLPLQYGFDGNISDGGTLFLDELSNAEFQDVDFGITENNTRFDILTSTFKEYQTGEDVSFTCSFGSCGTSLAYHVGLIPIDELHQNNSFRGNIYDIVGQPTLDSFEFHMNYTYCLFDFYVYSRTDPSLSWDLLWHTQREQYGTTDWVSSSSIGLALDEGTQILLGTSWDCDGSPDYYTYTSDYTTEYGIGTWAGTRAFAGGIDAQNTLVIEDIQTEISGYLYEQRIHATRLE